MSSSTDVPYRLLNCNVDSTLVEIARRHHVHHRDLWIPLSAAASLRAKSSKPVAISPTTQVALLNRSDGSILFQKLEICLKLHVAKALLCNEEDVMIAPADVPETFELFIRWDRPGTKHIEAKKQLLHCALHNDSHRGGSGASLCAILKRSRVDGAGDDGTSILQSTAVERHTQSLFHSRSAEDLERRLSAVLLAQGRPSHPTALHIQQTTLSNIQRREGDAPLHFVVSRNEPSVVVGGVRWTRPDPRVLYRVFRSERSNDRAEVSKYSDGSRYIRFYFIEDVLLCRTLNSIVSLPVESQSVDPLPFLQGSSSTTTQTTTSITAEEHAKRLLNDTLLADMKSHAERGYRIVFLDHYPTLHHGSSFTLETVLQPIADFCTLHCRDFTVTVVLAVTSYVNATQRHRRDFSFVLPQVGLLKLFTAQLNASLEPDPETTAVIGTNQRPSPFLRGTHSTFARNASLTYTDMEELQSYTARHVDVS